MEPDPGEVQRKLVDLTLEEPELSPRELSVRFTDREKYFVPEASAYRLLKAHDLITSPAYIVIKAAEEFKDKTTAPNLCLPKIRFVRRDDATHRPRARQCSAAKRTAEAVPLPRR